MILRPTNFVGLGISVKQEQEATSSHFLVEFSESSIVNLFF